VGKKNKASGFNTPFSKIKLPEKPPEKPVVKAAPPKPREEDDSELFLRAVSGVAPVKTTRTRVEPEKTLERKGPSDEELARIEFESFARGDGPFELSETEERQSGAAPGVTRELMGQLERGEFAFRRHIDLHGLTRDEAKVALARFISESRHQDERCVLVITGRGKSSPGGVSVLKEALPRWLSRAPSSSHVLAFATALQMHGGPGAFYVLLRRAGVKPFGV
jgi:DNA-nicking Smr family endonuclease